MGHQFFFVAELDDALRDFPQVLIAEFYAEGFKILLYVGLAGCLAECILAFAAKSFRQQIVEIQIVFVVAVGMYSGTLGEYRFADYRLVGGEHDA